MKKIERPKKVSIADRETPKTIEALTRKYDIQFNNIYNYLDKLVEEFNRREGE